jgi:Cell morphogenesis central region
MAALLAAPLWDSEHCTQSGAPFRWLNAMFMSLTPERNHLGIAASRCTRALPALRGLLLHNRAAAPVVLDRCYANEAPVATSYFAAQVDTAPAIVANGGLRMLGEPSALIALILYKLLDEQEAVRRGALELLQVVADGMSGVAPADTGSVSSASIAMGTVRLCLSTLTLMCCFHHLTIVKSGTR